jgi:hypothetical protein
MTVKQVKNRAQAALGRVSITVAIVVAATVYSTSSFADVGTAEQRAACTGDVLRLCATSIASNDAIIGCMTKNKDNLSKRCKMTLPPI